MNHTLISSRKAVLLAASFLALAAGMAHAQSDQAAFDVLFRQAASGWLDSLDPTQAAACVYAFDQRTRQATQFPGGHRDGIQISSLDVESRQQLETTMRMLLSDRGWERALAVAAQGTPGGLGKYYVTFFGDPRTGNDFAWRIAEHHLTILHVQFENDALAEFGPILFGANPPTLWTEEEDAILALARTLADQAGAAPVAGRGIASEQMADGLGVPVTSLSEAARGALDVIWANRLGVFSKPVRERVNRIVASRGGLETMRMAFYNEPAKQRCADGGRWDWKLSDEGFLLDFETSRAHVHMSIWAR